MSSDLQNQSSTGNGQNPLDVIPQDESGRSSLRLAPEDAVALVLFLALFGVVFSQFFFRYVVNQSFAWTEEFSRFLLVAVVFVASAGAVRRGSHISVQLLDSLLPPSAARIVNALTEFGTALFFGYAAWLSIEITSRAWGQNMSTLPLSRGWIYALVAAAFALMAVRAVQAALANWHRAKKQ